MTNIEKVKRILDAGHWVNIRYEHGEVYTIISEYNDSFAFIDTRNKVHFQILSFANCTIEVIQRIPTPYKAGDKVLVLSDISLSCYDSEGGADAAEYIDEMVGKVGIIKANNGAHYSVYNYDKSDFYYFPAHCLSPAFDEDSLSGKEAKIVIDGKEYACIIN